MSESDSAPTEIGGTIRAVVFHNEESGFTILQVEDASQSFTVRGRLPAATAGERIRATGRWKSDRRFGRQFEAERISALAPDSPAGIVRFLSSGLIEGIGATYAERIVAAFGTDTFRILEEESQRLEEVPGIGRSRRLRIKESWKRQKAVRDLMIFLHLHGLSTARALRLYKIYGQEAANILRADPYRLARDIPGVGFRTADAMARQMGQGADSPRRLGAGIEHVLSEAERQGHVALPRTELVSAATTLLDAPAPEIEAVLEDLLREGRLSRESGDPRDLVYLRELLEAEKAVARSIATLLRPAVTSSRSGDIRPRSGENFPRPGEGPSFFEANPPGSKETPPSSGANVLPEDVPLSPEQEEAVRRALAARIFVLTGGPGTGKTTILKALIRKLLERKVQPVLCAPTGRAAKRLSESAGREAFTLHRALEYQPVAGFARNRNRPLAGDLFVIDEASMVDLRLMAAFLGALPPHGAVLLVGDADQLPSVGAGRVLADLIESGRVPVARLSRIFRQGVGSRIVEAAHELKEGRLPALENPPGSDFFFIPREDPGAIAETVRHLVAERIPERFGLRPREDIQVLTPMNRQTLGTRELNARLQAALNPPGEWKNEIERFGTLFRTGDKVIQVRNNYEKEIFNGDIGHITEVTNEPVSIHVLFDGNTRVVYEPGELDELALAYAVTIHKSQGSEFPAVVIPLAAQHFPLLQRNLVYTAITRGKRLVILVGERRALEMAVRRSEGHLRHSGLPARIRTLADLAG